MANADAAASDTHDRRLLSHVRPPGWQNPPPHALYDLVVIGGGTAGLVCAAGAASLGARVALVEKWRLGGDCLHTGCVPSKALLRSARAIGEARAGTRVGVHGDAQVDFSAVMARLRARRADIAPHDSAARLTSLGVDVFFGHATFSGPRTITVRANDPDGPNDPNVLTFRKAVIATGSRPAVPPIPGLRDIPFLTSETVFDLADQPRRLLVLGGGAVGCEMAQAFARLGTRVTLIETQARLLSHEDGDAAEIVRTALAADGVEVRTGVRITAVSGVPAGIRIADERGEVTGDAVLVATGRVANADRLGLDAAGVQRDEDGVRVNDHLRTSNPRVYASGDVASRYKFTHAADAMSRIVVQNALFPVRKRMSGLVIPWCTFTDPELAHVGLTSAAAGGDVQTITVRLQDVDRAVVDEATAGFVRIHHRRGTIVGATMVGPAAGELIGTIAYAMQTRASVADLAGVVFPYPTLSLALRQAGDAYRRERLTPRVRKAFALYFRWSGSRLR
jgi:pyruvate/2-oxoglutarate dehydrogenase complex dihydrolipoamide dehydrogenase (E3) component